MKHVPLVRFFSEQNYQALTAKLDSFLKGYPDWETISVSHELFPGGVSVAIVMKFTGQNFKVQQIPHVSE